MRRRPSAYRQQGMFAPALIILLSLAGIGWLLARQPSAASVDLARESRTAQALGLAREALLGFAATYRSREHPNADFGYLPCPDLDGDGSSETCGGKDQTSVGRLPYLTLNLPDLRDGAGECLWYAVSGSFKNNPKADVLNWDSTGRFRIEDADAAVLKLAGDQAGHAAALVIAAGPPLPDQTRTPGPARCGGDTQARNIAHYIEALGALEGSGPIPVRPAAGNDRIATITTGDIFRQLKNRPSYAPWLQTVLQAVADCLTRPELPAVVAAAGHGPVEVGRLPPLERLGGSCRSESLRDAAANWAEVTRYARCIGGTACLGGPATRCRGALLFGGERRDPGQRRLDVADRQATDNYLEADTLALLAAGTIATLPNIIALPVALPAQAISTDVALCIP